jgi:hypothetical protein
LVKNSELPYKRSHINKFNKGGLIDFIKKYDIDLTDIKPSQEHVVEYAVVEDPSVVVVEPVVVEPVVVDPVVDQELPDILLLNTNLLLNTVQQLTVCKPIKPRKAPCTLKLSEKLDKDPTIIKKRKSSVVCFDYKKKTYKKVMSLY